MDSIIRDVPHLAAVLKSVRKRTHLTQAEAGAKVGLQQKNVSRLEGHLDKCNVDSLMKLITALGLNLVIRSADQPAAGESSTKVDW